MANQDNIRLWAEALESGRYPQSGRRLRDENGYCCLGVACEVFRLETGEGKWTDEDVPLLAFDAGDEPRSAYLPAQVYRWLGLQEDNPKLVLPSGNGTDCVTANDMLRMDFTAIAAALRRTYLEEE